MRTILKKDKLDVMKTDFINNMTHEIKTPIATIGLACKMLQDPSIASDPANNSTYIGIISDENRRMRLLIETILQNAKMSNKSFTLNRTTVDINDIIKNVTKSFNLKIESLGGILNIDLTEPSPTLSADELHITNMIYNLIDNAIKYSPEKVDIKITTRKDGDKLLLSIADKGLGISREDQKHIFEKFYRVSTGDVHNVKGFGIGLNYVMQVVNAHGGKISVNSTLGEGSTFTVELPIIN